MGKASRVEKGIMMDLMREKITYAQAQRAFRDPAAWRLSKRIVASEKARKGSYRWWGKLKTKRMVVAYCWSCHRNEAGYFLGWREVYDANGNYTRDQYVARKVKRRLQELQKRRTDALLAKGAIKLR